MSVTDKLAARLPAIGDRIDRSPVVAVVKLHGVITPASSPFGRGVINISAVESTLARAFAHDRLQAVALAINSPGGAPTQSALVAERIRGLAEEKGVPVLAFCEDVAASGGYWLACAADEVFAHSTSVVGSIGVISAGFGLNGLIERFGVERRLHTAGAHKSRLDPFRPEQADDVRWLAEMQSELHELFIDWVRSRRGDKLNGTPEELFSGEVWIGAKAVERGLADHVGSMRSVLAQRYPDAHVVVAERRRPLLARLGVGAPGAARFGPDQLLAAVEALESRAAWSRFGL